MKKHLEGTIFSKKSNMALDIFIKKVFPLFLFNFNLIPADYSMSKIGCIDSVCVCTGDGGVRRSSPCPRPPQ